MVKSSLRGNYLFILYIIFQLQYEDSESDFILKDLIYKKLLTFPVIKRKFLKLDWKIEGFNRAIYRLQDVKMIESQVMIKNERKRKMVKLTYLGEQMVQEFYSGLKFIFSSTFTSNRNPFPASSEFFKVDN